MFGDRYNPSTACYAALPFVTEVGGYKRGGAKLTATGKQVVAIYHAIESLAHTASFHELQALVTMSRKHQRSTGAVERAEKL